MHDTTITTRRPASEFDNTVFNLAIDKTDAEYAGYVRGMFDCGCEHCFGKLLYEETETFLTEAENDKLYEFMLETSKIADEMRAEIEYRESDELTAILIERTIKRCNR